MIKLILIKLLSLLVVAGVCSSCGITGGSDAAQETRKIGVYDSRSIAAAYADSPMHQAEIAKELKRYEGTEEFDDEAHGSMQAALDRSYTKEPVDDLLKKIGNKLPGIKKKADVSILVSKWDAQGLKKYQGLKQVDVTMALVDAFDPTPSQRRQAVGVQNWAPPEKGAIASKCLLVQE